MDEHRPTPIPSSQGRVSYFFSWQMTPRLQRASRSPLSLSSHGAVPFPSTTPLGAPFQQLFAADLPRVQAIASGYQSFFYDEISSSLFTLGAEIEAAFFLGSAFVP